MRAGMVPFTGAAVTLLAGGTAAAEAVFIAAWMSCAASTGVRGCPLGVVAGEVEVAGDVAGGGVVVAAPTLSTPVVTMPAAASPATTPLMCPRVSLMILVLGVAGVLVSLRL
ncbi:Uncharacterised protein [Dermatophilus congolensis]|uniref:Uncharacterized protein n=1 Tax=Dermatophilus congolensis TaxID=1863 RepID=A0AA46BQB9_9MICO|nr:Uncharacterised protein [Dermatophilus congolensis]